MKLTAEAKKPAKRWKQWQTTSPSEAILCRWFGPGRCTGLAAITGDASGGLVCRDFDDMPAYHRWEAEHPDLAKVLPTVETRRGRHVYCRAAPGAMKRARDEIGKPDGTGAIHLADGELR